MRGHKESGFRFTRFQVRVCFRYEMCLYPYYPYCVHGFGCKLIPGTPVSRRCGKDGFEIVPIGREISISALVPFVQHAQSITVINLCVTLRWCIRAAAVDHAVSYTHLTLPTKA